jgi:endonuclease/exonuclease/phosphatase family metal-dependent hydrolase
MKQFFKFIFRCILLLLLAIGGFYFWGSSPNLEEADYKVLISDEDVDHQKNDSLFSIITYNIGYLSGMTNNRSIAKPRALFDKNLKKVILETKKVDPDIIAFQEIDYNASRSYHINQQEEIAKLGYAYRAQAVNWDEQYVPFPYWPTSMHFGKVVSGQSVISKYPLKEHKRIVLERVADASFYRDAFYLERLAQVVKVVLNEKEVVLINVHLEAFDKSTRARQFKEVIAIFNQYKNEYPVILLGDFNSKARDSNAVIQQLFTMPTIGNAAFNKANLINTFDSENPVERIDYIFYTKNSIEYIFGKVLTEFEQASDHLPVLMQFKLK